MHYIFILSVDNNPIQPSRSDGKENFDLEEGDDKENELEFTTRTNKVKSKTVNNLILEYSFFN